MPNDRQVVAQVLVLGKRTEDSELVYPVEVAELAVAAAQEHIAAGRMFVFPLEVMLYSAEVEVPITHLGDSMGVVKRMWIAPSGAHAACIWVELELLSAPAEAYKYRLTGFGTVIDGVVKNDYRIQHVNVQHDPDLGLRNKALAKRRSRSVTT